MSFTYTRHIDIDVSNDPRNNDFTVVPVLISVVDENLRHVSKGGHVASDMGYDVAFYWYKRLSFQIPAERQTYNPVTGQWSGWVEIVLGAGPIVAVTMLYGDSNVVSDPNDGPYGSSVVWSYGYTKEQSGTLFPSTLTPEKLIIPRANPPEQRLVVVEPEDRTAIVRSDARLVTVSYEHRFIIAEKTQ